jgi:hypothetical protein
MAERRARLTGRVILGLIAMFVGFLWTLDNFNLVESEPIIQWWPMALIVVGLAKLTGIATRRHVIWGVTFTVVGIWLLFGTLDLVEVQLWQLWPVALIAVGLHLVSRAFNPAGPGESVDDPSSYVNVFSFWSYAMRKVTSPTFRGGELTTVMAGADLDLRNARAAPGGASIDVFVWWGGITVIVPETWRVVCEATAIMGGIEDKTKMLAAEGQDTLYIRGLVVMGGIELKNPS